MPATGHPMAEPRQEHSRDLQPLPPPPQGYGLPPLKEGKSRLSAPWEYVTATGILKGRRMGKTFMAYLVGLANDLYEIRETINRLTDKGVKAAARLAEEAASAALRNTITMVNQHNAWKTKASGLDNLYGRPERTFMRGAFAWILLHDDAALKDKVAELIGLPRPKCLLGATPDQVLAYVAVKSLQRVFDLAEKGSEGGPSLRDRVKALEHETPPRPTTSSGCWPESCSGCWSRGLRGRKRPTASGSCSRSALAPRLAGRRVIFHLSLQFFTH